MFASEVINCGNWILILMGGRPALSQSMPLEFQIVQSNCYSKLNFTFWAWSTKNSYLTSPFKGLNIVDLDFVYNQLLDGHKPCNITLSLTQYQRERLIGLTRILYLSLQNCSTVTMVKTSIYDVNAKCTADMYSKFLLCAYLRVRIIPCKLILFLNELDIY